MSMRKGLLTLMLSSGLMIAGCSFNDIVEGKEAQQSTTQKAEKQDKHASIGEARTKILTSTNWQGTKVYDEKGKDLTEVNRDFIGLAKYDKKTNRYEFFDKNTGKTRGDEGLFFITNDGKKRILISESKNYQAVVDVTKLSNKKFTYKRMGKDENGKETKVYVEHVPYNENKLRFTNSNKKLTSKTGKIIHGTQGDLILGKKLWNGTKVLDSKGKDLTKYNKNFISLAKFDAKTNKYEFFDLKSGESRGDYGYFDVINNNKIRAHVSLGKNKYGAALELTELNDKRFTYKRMGQDANGNETVIFVEHEPYKGNLKPAFSF